MSKNKKFSMCFTLAELYGLRNALRKVGNEPEILAKIEEKINYLHAYFDGRLREWEKWRLKND